MKSKSIFLEENYNLVHNNEVNDTETSSTKLPGAVLTGIIVGSVLILIFVLFIVICLIAKCRKRRKGNKMKKIIRNKTKEFDTSNKKEKLITEDENFADPKNTEQVVKPEKSKKLLKDGDLQTEKTGQRMERAEEKEFEVHKKSSGIPELLTKSSQPVINGRSQRNSTSRPIKSSRVSPSQLYVPNSDSKSQTKSPYSVMSSTNGLLTVSESPSQATLASINKNNRGSNNKQMKALHAPYEPVTENEIAQKSTLDNDDGNVHDDVNGKKSEESVTNIITPTATLTTEKMKEMMKQMNLEVGNSSLLGSNIEGRKSEGAQTKGGEKHFDSKKDQEEGLRQSYKNKNKKMKVGRCKDRKKRGKKDNNRK